MSILDDDEDKSSDSDGAVKIRPIPPPPPPVNHVLSILFGVLALVAAYLRAWGPGVAFAATSLAFNVVAFVQIRAYSRRIAEANATQAPKPTGPAGRGPAG